MTSMIFVNLPVANLSAAIKFYQAVGFDNNPKFTDDTAACMVWSENIHVMLLTHEKWRHFTQRPIPEISSSEVMLALSLTDKKRVDVMLKTAHECGGIADVNPVQDFGFMYGRAFTDLDGHVWEAMWMDPAAAAE
ncbi:VOC family protein [Thalassotalea sp. PP2-459]|uniref:VOC family protein n=1 Tax=Thalassotalea sp. PP2-459 TaxID=1742724 RepID=UPI000945CBBE|nr:lactoylglutathione lyase [Thalassotalea sp. PP2-459]OKY26026.1 lactoylglutathione lyase [Thalassotalea sp. PP2-459]